MAKPMKAFNPELTYRDPLTDQPLSGGLMYFYQPGTTTQITTYTDSTLGTPNPNPIVLSTAGVCTTPIYVTQTFRFVLTRSTDTNPPTNAIYDEDNITTLGQLVSTTTKTTNYTTLVTDRDKLILVSAASAPVTITVLLGSTAGDGFNLKVKKIDSSANAVTIQMSGSDTLDGSSSIQITKDNDYMEFYNSQGTTAWYSVRSVPQVLRDANANIALQINTTASAVNYVTITDAATGNAPIVGVDGSDTNIDLKLTPKGTGKVQIGTLPFAFPNADASTAKCAMITNASKTLSFTAEPVITKVNIVKFTASGTYTPSANTQYIRARARGGSGAGGGSSSTSGAAQVSAGGGGGSGAYSEGVFTIASVGASQAVVVGTGGVGSAAATGGNGGNTTFMTLSAGGGTGGNTNSASSGTLIVLGGAAGTASGGTVNINGSPGQPAILVSSTAAWSGNGGGDGGGLGVGQSGASAVGNNGASYGGGSGAASQGGAGTATRAGGNGADGVVIIEEFISD